LPEVKDPVMCPEIFLEDWQPI